MKKDDPKRLKLQAERERTQLWFDILCKGIAGSLAANEFRYADTDSIKLLVAIINEELLLAAERAEAAYEAYRPYWGRRRRTIIRPKKTKAAKAK